MDVFHFKNILCTIYILYIPTYTYCKFVMPVQRFLCSKYIFTLAREFRDYGL